MFYVLFYQMIYTKSESRIEIIYFHSFIGRGSQSYLVLWQFFIIFFLRFKYFQEVKVFYGSQVLEPETQQNGNAEQKSVILWCATKHYTWNYTFLMRQSFEILPRVVCRVKYLQKVLNKREIFSFCITIKFWMLQKSLRCTIGINYR